MSRLQAIHKEGCFPMQDKLHQNLCRQRSLVAIGTHDLGTLQPPFTYEALPPEAISFVPLKQTRSFRADELLTVPSSASIRDWVRLDLCNIGASHQKRKSCTSISHIRAHL